MAETSSFKVIIAGGGIAGLTLANCLQHADIDYVILEARDVVAPNVGASIGMFSNGGRILDQLGVYDDILAQTEPTKWMSNWKDGKLIIRKDAPQLLQARTGYPITFGDRQMVLQALYDGIRKKSSVLVNKRVASVDHSEKGVTVHCTDGSMYDGDVAIGADGVHSMIRHEMWRIADITEPGRISKEEKDTMMSEYTCVYGISSESDLPPGGIEVVHGHDVSALAIVGKEKRTFWFLINKMDQQYRVPNIPRWTKKDAEKRIQAHLDFRLTDKVTLGDIWKNTISCTLVSMEEASFKTWTWGRFACLGDSIHKMTPNIGQGGNNAIESAAVLANNLKRMLSNGGPTKPSFQHVKDTLLNYQKTREVRTKAILEISNMMTRVEALRGIPETLMALYITPNAGDYFTDLACNSTIGAEKVEFLPDPERSYLGTMPFNKNRGVGQEESRLLRALVALPILAIGYCCYLAMKAIASSSTLVSQLSTALTTGTLPFDTYPAITLATSYYGPLSFLNTTFRPIIGLFSPALLEADIPQRLQLLFFLTDIGPIYLIWTLESHRRANVLTFARFPLLFGLAFQLFGIGSIAPLYYGLHYIQSPLSQFQAGDLRMHTVSYAKTALPALIIAYFIPTFAMFFAPSLSSRLSWNALWQLFPLLVTVTHYLLARFAVTDTTRSTRLQNPITADLKYIRISSLTLTLFSAIVFNLIRFTSPFSLTTIFLPATLSPIRLLVSYRTLDLVAGMNLLLKADHLSCVIASFAWLALLFKDLKESEIIRSSWLKLVLFAAIGLFVAGPSPVVISGWWIREEALASRPAKGAVVRTPLGKKYAY